MNMQISFAYLLHLKRPNLFYYLKNIYVSVQAVWIELSNFSKTSLPSIIQLSNSRQIVQ